MSSSVKRKCAWCGKQLVVLEARDEKTGKLVDVPEVVVCSECVKKTRRREWRA